MSAKNNPKNNVIRSIRPMVTRHGEPTPQPLNAAQGSTRGGPNNYGRGRGPPVWGKYRLRDLMQWRSGPATSIQKYEGTQLPRRRA